MESYYTVEQISELLNLHPKTVQRYIREGRLHAVKLGKAWRVSGHDLSVFTENGDGGATAAQTPADVTVSAVADIRISGRTAAMRVTDALTAALNAKPPEYGRSSMHTQYIENDGTLRVTLWGGARFMSAMMDAIESLTADEEAEASW